MRTISWPPRHTCRDVHTHFREHALPQLLTRVGMLGHAEAEGMTDIRTADWSEEVAPFWKAVIQTALSGAGFAGLLRAGWTTIKVIMHIACTTTKVGVCIAWTTTKVGMCIAWTTIKVGVCIAWQMPGGRGRLGSLFLVHARMMLEGTPQGMAHRSSLTLPFYLHATVSSSSTC